MARIPPYSSYDSKKSESAGSTDTNRSSSCNQHFFFPPAPRLCKSATSCSPSCQSDSSASDGRIIKSKKRSRRRYVKSPPIGVYWDIENCQVPKNKSASTIVQRIREIFFEGHREADFIVVCDVKKENPQVIQDLHDAQVNLIHVSSTSKNAADEKLRQSLRRFAETHTPPATVVLISGDVNFAADLSDLRYRKKIHVILVHNTNVADALILCANETYTYASITDNLPELKNKGTEFVDLDICNLPLNFDKKPLKNRLKFLSDNCGGKVTEVNNELGTAKLRFSSSDYAVRAQRRLNGEDVFGRKIVVSNPNGDWRAYNSPRHFGRKITKNNEGFQHNTPTTGYASHENSTRETHWRSCMDKTNKTQLVLQEPNIFRTSRSCPPSAEGVWGRKYGKPRTPQDEVMNISLQKHRSDFNEQSKNFAAQNNTFQPISNQVELIITNLDSSIKDLRNVLMNLLKEHAMIYSLNVNQGEGNTMAVVRVGSQQDAHNIISQMHHHKLGFKRLSISYAQNNSLDTTHLKEMVILLLQEAPGNSMPLYRLLNVLEERFLTNVSVSEVNKLRDICRICDENGERIISLAPEVRSSPLSNLQRIQTLYCSVHCPNGLSMQELGWGSDEPDSLEIPHIIMPLKEFTLKLNALLSSHMGTLPLLSFAICYKNEFATDLPLNDSGVPLEHLVTCVNNIKLKVGGSNRNTKYIVRDITLKLSEGDEDDAYIKSRLSPSISSNITLLCRELVDLLKTTERCQLQLGKYIPAYHHHFGRQLRVADYGYTKLSDLLLSPSIANIVQILGEGSKRVITLTHSAQLRRFTSDLLRVLKSRVAKQLTAEEFPAAYERVLNKPFNAVEYGLCYLEDLLDEVPDNTVVITKTEEGLVMTIPKREQTSEEMLRTKQFSEEVIKLLSYSPQCSMLFNKFVPAYHHHFGHQCKVSDFGFTKLIELFEAIPDTVRIEELSNGERKVCLTLNRALTLQGNQIVDLIKKSHLSYLPLESLPSAYQREYGYPLKPQISECKDVNELIAKLTDFIQINYSSAGPLLVPVENTTESTLAMRVWAILINPPHHMNLVALTNMYQMRYQCSTNMLQLEQLNNIIINRSTNMETLVFLTPPYATAAKLYLMLVKEGGQVPYNALDGLYRMYYGVPLLQNEGDGYEKLLSDFSFLIIMRRTRKRTNIALNPKINHFGLFLTKTKKSNNFNNRPEENVNWPPLPVHDLVFDSRNRGITPPKPDTPPPMGAAQWNNWDSPSKFSSDMPFSIEMPEIETPKMSTHFDSLISPTKNLLPANGYSMDDAMAVVSAPDPHDLPMPDKLLKKGTASDDSTDSGVNNSNLTSENEMDCSNNGKVDFKMPFLLKN